LFQLPASTSEWQERYESPMNFWSQIHRVALGSKWMHCLKSQWTPNKDREHSRFPVAMHLSLRSHKQDLLGATKIQIKIQLGTCYCLYRTSKESEDTSYMCYLTAATKESNIEITENERTTRIFHFHTRYTVVLQEAYFA
jgi:hypothetical protein